MNKERMTAFSDGVIAIIITIMVLELKVPHGSELVELRPVLPVFLSYIMSFVYLGIYWNNHHHLLQAVNKVNGKILWANLHLLFWLSLIPFVTGWIGENELKTWPAALYGIVLLGAAIAYFVLTKCLIAHHGKNSVIAKAIGRGFKDSLSVVIYVLAILLSFLNPWISVALYIIVAIMWFTPDPRIEKNLR